MLAKTIASYLYVEYADDDDLQAFVASFNNLSQSFVDWYNALNLPIYTTDPVSGALLDWVGQGIYGISRPVLSSNIEELQGPFNTYMLNTLGFNEITVTAPASTVYVTTDDIYRRVLTWLFYKGDGKTFSIPWLKRRVMRFLYGTDGVDPGVSSTYPVSVTCSGLTITIDVSAVGGYIATVFSEAVAAGVLELPFQYDYSVTT